MKRIRTLVIVAGLSGALIPLIGQSAPKAASRDQGAARSKPASGRGVSKGERVFKQNCSRCHNAPQNFSPQISGTIVRHMRARASLSVSDEKEILQFLNP